MKSNRSKAGRIEPPGSTRPTFPSPWTAFAWILPLLILAYPAPALSQAQSAALEYYVQPDYTGVNTLGVTTGGLSLTNDLVGVALTFNTGGFFEREFVSQSPIDFSAVIDVTIPEFAGAVPVAETNVPVTGGTFQLTTSQGEIIEGQIGDQSVVRLVPYPPAPRVFFYELTLVPSSTSVVPQQSVDFSLDAIKTWGILVTNGQTFDGAFGYGQNHQYEGSAIF